MTPGANVHEASGDTRADCRSVRATRRSEAGTVRVVLQRLFEQVGALVAPPACVACREPVAAAHELLCPGCRRRLPWLTPRLCRHCGLPSPCRPCPARRAAFDAAWAPLAHEGPARDLVVALKFRGALRVADAMAAPIVAHAPAGLLAKGTLVPAPLHPARRRARGFDQALLLARAIARRTGLPLAACLRRGGAPTRQLGTGRAGRLAAGRIAVRVAGAAPPRVILVDDVHTTGATLDACAGPLREAGAREVVCVTYARTLRR
jgi:predicted amidophosphoribosyltransferase